MADAGYAKGIVGAALTVLGVCLWAAPIAAETTAVARPGVAPRLADGEVLVGEEGGTLRLRVEGIITHVVEERLGAELARLAPGRPVVIELNSPGGFTSAGYRIIDTILAERQAGRPIATRVRARQSCESMCVAVYLAGYPRLAAPSAEFMVHAPRLAEDGRMTLRATMAMESRLAALGVSSVWLAQVKAAGGFSGDSDYRVRAEDLAQAKANVVTDLIH